ncbi:hypothetical protein D9756_004596 [Leucocoprinus leucothites]|uniref:DUF6699 domain-containing protein n=1 Tax=Leucocoprinus leucothites TaxID=201217 RepID=A0A8H5G9F0_9AGAR|nr:hypothetical protein D9756_004596 [Leucoagaricus leucothites]
MTSRRVRFVGVEDSPQSTSSTLSSPGPLTPQQLPQPLVHVRYPSPTYTNSSGFSPSHVALSIPYELHNALATLAFDFDASLDPADNPALRDNPYIARMRNEPATTPPAPSLTLVSRHLPWEIIISSSASSYVTISDVLGGLYRALRIPAREEEYLRESSEKQTAISLAYYQRFERISNVGLREIEKQKGVKRIDFLASAHRFRGLHKTNRPNVWDIKFKSS